MKIFTKFTLLIISFLVCGLTWAERNVKDVTLGSQNLLPEVKFCDPSCPPGGDQDN